MEKLKEIFYETERRLFYCADPKGRVNLRNGTYHITCGDPSAEVYLIPKGTPLMYIPNRTRRIMFQAGVDINIHDCPKFIPIMRGSAVDLAHKVYLGSLPIRDLAEALADDVCFTNQVEVESYFYFEKTV